MTFSTETMGAYCGEGEMNVREAEKSLEPFPHRLRAAHWMRLVWNLLRSRFSLPSNIREAMRRKLE